MNPIEPEKNQAHIDILLPLPGEMIRDLKKIAAFNNSELKDLIYSYVVDGLASDSLIIKRLEVDNAADKNSGYKSIHAKTAREILKDFKLAY